MTVPRRTFAAVLGLGGVAVWSRARAQAPARIPRVGYVGRSPIAVQAFTEGLKEAGYTVGTNISLDVRIPETDTSDVYAALAAQLVAGGPDVLLAANPHAVEALVRATRTIPIVAVDLESDAVARGWVSSLARPGGLTVQPAHVTAAGDIRAAIAEAARQRAGALMVLSAPVMFANLRPIAEGALRHRLPRSISSSRSSPRPAVSSPTGPPSAISFAAPATTWTASSGGPAQATCRSSARAGSI